ncbi:hypothetical protein ACU5B6_12240 [Moritella viscosa]|uniref:hypothetical protein n=1 Tax=Moritella viscosa TaxID=80854 RepID=UPI00092289D4|nr:hypothetical protein [Moritella viscosa]SHN99563.1 Putative uncharacterized protein [Moritella viscosa]SHN99565.1 Putative uncharacterized protein [Moritella viscosa]SHO02181.1 Putative uncharacterized protein [Moritella viscosa]SHO18040.1 Putative uncharacterized protein [Moritella viscosa]
MRSIGDLKHELKDQDIKQSHFCREYFVNRVLPDATSAQLSDHYARFKKLTINSTPERVMPYINFFMQAYCKDSIYTQADRSAAWEMWVELDTRIATQQLAKEEGVDKSALTSIYALFQIHRELAKRHGPNCKSYYLLAKGYFENEIRPFTAKWHQHLDEESSDIFRKELYQLQEKLNEFKSKLEQVSG